MAEWKLQPPYTLRLSTLSTNKGSILQLTVTLHAMIKSADEPLV
jgi:hypothetical protein